MKSITKQQAAKKAAALCAASEQCKSDIAQKLRRWGLTDDEADEVTERLVAEGFIDEGRYARAFAHDHLRYNGWGRVKIAFALRQKRLADSHISQALDAIDNEWADDYDRALEAAVSGGDEWSKTARRAAARGFTMDEICAKLRTN